MSSLSIVCDFCLKELTEFGALLLSPPENGYVEKYHVCVNCYNRMVDWQTNNIAMDEK